MILFFSPDLGVDHRGWRRPPGGFRGRPHPEGQEAEDEGEGRQEGQAGHDEAPLHRAGHVGVHGVAGQH